MMTLLPGFASFAAIAYPGPTPSVPSGPGSSHWPIFEMRSTDAAVATKSPPSPITIVFSSRTPSISLQSRSGLIGAASDSISARICSTRSASLTRRPFTHSRTAGLPPRAMPVAAAVSAAITMPVSPGMPTST